MKKSVKLAILFLGILICLILYTGKVQAASATISGDQTVTVGSQVTVSASVTAGAWNLNLSGAGQNKPLVGQTTVAANASSSTSITFTASNTGTYVFNLTGDMTDFSQDNAESVSKKCTITVVQSSSNNNQSNGNASNGDSNSNSNNSNNGNNNGSSNGSSNNNANTKSNIATLNNLGITPNDFSGFSPSKTSYNVTVPNNVENIEIYAKKGHSDQTITGTGKKALQEGTNTFQVVVTAQDGSTKKTYTIAVTREKSTTEESDPEEKEETSKNTENTENEEETTGEIGFGLSNLTLEDIRLTPEFKTDIYEYKVKLIGDKTEISIDTTATEENAKIEITGNEELKEGENIITILVTDESGTKNATYQIVLTKNLVDEDAIANQKKMEEEKQRKIILIAAGITLVVLIIIIGMMIHKKRNRYVDDYTIPYSNLNSEDDGFYMEDEKDIKEDNIQIESTNELTDEDEYKEEKMKKKKHGKGKRFK